MKKNMVSLLALDAMNQQEIAVLLSCIEETMQLYAVYQREIFQDAFLEIVAGTDENLCTFLQFLKTNKLIQKSDLVHIKKALLLAGDYVQYIVGGSNELVTNELEDIVTKYHHPHTISTKETPGFTALMHDKLYMRNIDRDLNLLLH